MTWRGPRGHKCCSGQVWRGRVVFSPLPYHVAFYLNDAVHIKNSTEHHTSKVLFFFRGTSGIGDSNAPAPTASSSLDNY